MSTSLTKQSGVLIIGRILAFLANFLVPVILVRILTKSEYGAYRQLLLIFVSFFPILQLGVSQSIYYFFPKDPDKRNVLIRQSAAMLSITGGLFFIVLMVLSPAVSLHLFKNTDLTTALPIMGAFTALMIPASLIEILLVVEGRVKLASAVTFVSSIIRSVAVLTIAYFSRNIYWISVGLAVFGAVRLLFLVWYAQRRYGVLSKVWDEEYLQQQLRYALPFGAAVVLVTLNISIDKFGVSYLFDAADYAVYITGCYQVPFITIIFNAVLDVTLPSIVRSVNDGDGESARSIWHDAVRKLALIGIPMFAYFMIMADPFIVFLFTPQYSASVPIFRISLGFMLADLTMYGAVVRAYGMTRYVLKTAVISLCIAMVLFYPAIRWLGLAGAVGVILVSHYCRALFQLAKARRIMAEWPGRLLPWSEIASIAIATVVPAATVVMLRIFTPISGITLLIVTGCIFFSLYGILIWNVKNVVRPNEKRGVIRMITARFS